ncbi:cytochrome P450 protein [Rutstroemia sp. NJR-2017a BBW]|nr:cytochrome P450 protein [Rutstroemia sp. NJR-2017a BBW]
MDHSQKSSISCSWVTSPFSILHLAWEFTESNFFTFVVPNTAFGILGAFAGSRLSNDSVTHPLDLLRRFPIVVAFNWLNVLVFDLSNQRHPESIHEDLANKPWRPIPTGKVTPEQTRRGVLAAVPIVLLFNYFSGVWKEGAFIQILVWLYNDVRGGDEIFRDLIIAIAYGLFNTASLRIAFGGLATISSDGLIWVGIISAVILTTMQVQDLKDQEGDRGRGRKTIVLVMGENVSRYSIATCVLFWTYTCLSFWKISVWAIVVPMTPALLVAGRVLLQRNPHEDAHTWRLWCLWTITLYCLPVIGTFMPNLDLRLFLLMNNRAFLVIGFLLGIIVHQSIFIRGEWHIQAPLIAIIHVSIYLYIRISTTYCEGTDLGELLRRLLLITNGYVPGLCASIVIYRVFFHPLTKAGFSGPWYARVTKLWHVWACRNSKNHQVLNSLQEKYGDFVRTGPNEITVFHPDAFMATDGPRSTCIKSDWYDIIYPTQALVTTRDKSIHGARRRHWNRGFSKTALEKYESRILRHVNKLEKCIMADVIASRESDARSLLYWFAFDAMGDFVFGRPFGMLDKRDWHLIITKLRRALTLMAPFSPAPWLIQIGLWLPRFHVIKDWWEMIGWCQRQMQERIKEGSNHLEPDLTHYLTKSDLKVESSNENIMSWLDGDSLLGVVAGSNPIASSLLAVFTELAKNPQYIKSLHKEVKDVDCTDSRTLATLTFLNAVLDESMRLHPALMTGGIRQASKDGVTIAGVFIPSLTNIVAPQYCIARDSKCFVRPQEFIPERWTTKPELVLNPSAVSPFGTGLHSCVGKALALDSMRFLISKILKKYSFRLAEGDRGDCMDEQMKDQFVSNPGNLRLVFTVPCEEIMKW